MKNKKIKIIVAVVVMVSIVSISLSLIAKNATADETIVTKETKVEKGNITAGVTESGSVTVGTNAMTYELDLSAATSSSSNSSSSSGNSNSNASSGTNNSGAVNGFTGPSALGSSNGSSLNQGFSSSVSSGSSSSSTEGFLVVDTVYVAVGQNVAVGDKLMSLTADSVAAAKKLLEDDVENAELAVSEAKVTDKQIKITAESEYKLNIAQGKTAKSVYNATIDSIESNISSLKKQIADTTDSNRLSSLKAQLSQAQSEESAKKLEAKQTYELALVNYENAKSIYDVAMSQYGSATKEAEETLKEAKEKLKDLEALVSSDNIICSSYEGRIVDIGYAAGDTLSTDTAIVQFADVTAVTVSVNVTQDDIAAVNLEDEVNVEFISDSENMYQGTVTEIGSAVTSSSTVSYPVTILVTSIPDKVLTGMTANVTFIAKEVKNILYVSNKAIISEGVKSYVNVKKEDGTVTRIEVTTGFSNGENVEIKSGLSEGDTVLIESKVNS